MATKKKVKAEPDGLLVSAAKTIGTAAGKMAAAVGIAPLEEHQRVKSAKKRAVSLPRKRKKATKKPITSQPKTRQ